MAKIYLIGITDSITPVTEMQQDRTDMPSHLLSLEKKKLKILTQK